VKLFGPKLSTSSGESPTATALAGKAGVAIYFSAHWCPPCRGFTPKLAEAYTEHLKAKGLEIVFVSSDRDDAAFQSYFRTMPWLAVPFADRKAKQSLGERFSVSGIPSLIILDANAKVITTDGRGQVLKDPTGKWMPAPLPMSVPKPEVGAPGVDAVMSIGPSAANTDAFVKLFGPKLSTSSGESPTATALAGKAGVAIYFSAHWCPPCRGFTPKLAEAYTEHLKAKGLEIVFVSSDRDDAAFQSYFRTMPWLAVPFADRKAKQSLGERFSVSGIPSLIILDANAKVITTDGRGQVLKDPTGKWMPAPLPMSVAAAPAA